jgi:para-aminobenzoate synthetase
MRARHVRVFEHPAGVGESPGPPATRGNRTFPRVATLENLTQTPGSPPPEAYAAAFAQVQEELHAGNSYEVNLTYRLTEQTDLDPAAAYLRLRDLNPAPYAGFLQHDVDGHRAWLLSSSPERYALITPDRTLQTKPIKGTTPRGATKDEDEDLRRTLASDPKTRAENLMIVDLLRNDLAMVCKAGSVEVPALMQVESYHSVHQLVTEVRGRLRDDVSTMAALRALFPAGSMTGAPKRRTMEIIDEVEATPRGAYAGAFGWISGDGAVDLGVVIRSVMTSGDGTWTMGTGGGITVRSEVDAEWAESRWKAARLLSVFGSDQAFDQAFDRA